LQRVFFKRYFNRARERIKAAGQHHLPGRRGKSAVSRGWEII
jgi:hypothetical protein